ncbi:hypothetical protein P9G84_10280 [Brevibacillus centrosporus]|uniref:hypothetical protein n=1 Tax=Brevibacillus centrosporus TaxID=54910 RepID=UPI001144A8B6|nr:hypothetical protein [Brevibacillus centrosporus]MEC2129355.1 hypothetical protein [Brevibacillus centrosporus]GED33523.1 hypothetical protein BCE02nite_46640 [Brevibacillus centrosporus]
MIRITIEEIKTAIEATGMQFIQRSYGNRDKNCGCPITIVAMYRNMKPQKTLGEIILAMEDHSVKDIRSIFGEEMDLSYVHGFMDGFDQFSAYSREAFSNEDAFNAYQLGHNDGALAAQTLLPVAMLQQEEAVTC